MKNTGECEKCKQADIQLDHKDRIIKQLRTQLAAAQATIARHWLAKVGDTTALDAAIAEAIEKAKEKGSQKGA
jgi:hypothetical protein